MSLNTQKCLIIIFPIMIFIIYISTFTLLKLKRGRVLTKELLILLGNIEPWHMSDIFLVSILVSIVKLFDMAKIYIGISFWALFAFVLINIYISRNIHLGELWILRKNIYYGNKRKIDR